MRVNKIVPLLLLVLLLAFGLPRAVQAYVVSYDDVPSQAWYKSAASTAGYYGLMKGTGLRLFSPEADLTRADFVVVLGRLYEWRNEDIKAGPDDFSDTEDSAYYARYVAWAAENGLIEGYGDGRFGPKDPVTREQMAVMIYNYTEKMDVEFLEEPGEAITYGDASLISPWAQEGVKGLSSYAILRGDENSNFNPQATATRAEAAAVFVRTFLLVNDLSDLVFPADISF